MNEYEERQVNELLRMHEGIRLTVEQRVSYIRKLASHFNLIDPWKFSPEYHDNQS